MCILPLICAYSHGFVCIYDLCFYLSNICTCVGISRWFTADYLRFVCIRPRFVLATKFCIHITKSSMWLKVDDKMCACFNVHMLITKKICMHIVKESECIIITENSYVYYHRILAISQRIYCNRLLTMKQKLLLHILYDINVL